MTSTISSSWPDLLRPSRSSFDAIIQDVDARDKRGHDEGRSLLRLEWPRQQAFDRRIDRHLAGQDGRDRI